MNCIPFCHVCKERKPYEEMYVVSVRSPEIKGVSFWSDLLDEEGRHWDEYQFCHDCVSSHFAMVLINYAIQGTKHLTETDQLHNNGNEY